MGEDCQHEDAYWDSCQQLDTASQRIAALEAELATERTARQEAEDTAHRYRSRTHLAEEREAALRARLVVLTTGNASDFGATGNNDVLLALQRYARATLSQPSPAAERVKALIDAAIRWAEARNGCLETCHGAQSLAGYGQASDELEAAVQAVEE